MKTFQSLDRGRAGLDCNLDHHFTCACQFDPFNLPAANLVIGGFQIHKRNGDVRSSPTKSDEDGIRKLEFKLRRAKERETYAQSGY